MKIALSVTGSISAYKAYDLTRAYVKNGHQVRVLVSRGALQFIKLETFLYLGAEAAYSPERDFQPEEYDLGGTVLHIDLAKWADSLIFAPLSANSLAKLCTGSADDLISSLFLAWKKDKPILAFPAMNSEMLDHPFVSENLKKLSTLPNAFIGPTESGELACGDIGAGKLAKIETILALTETISFRSSQKSVLITAGATVSPLDSVRFLTNASSGKTAIPLIKEALSRGHRVQVLAGVYATSELNHFLAHPRFSLKRFSTTKNLYEQVLEAFPQCDTYISAAAIGDIEFKGLSGKLKKSSLSDNLPIEKSPDILKSVLAMKKPHQKVVGFAAETELSDEVLKEKWQRKPVDLLVGTQVTSGVLEGSEAQGFGTDKALYRFMKNPQEVSALEELSKSEMAKRMSLEILDKHDESFS